MTRPLLDELDRRLIGALHLAPRATWDDIAGVLAADASTLKRRYDRLSEARMVRVIGQADWGMHSRAMPVHVLLDITGETPLTVLDRLRDLPHLQFLAQISGDYPLYAVVHAPSEAATSEAIDRMYSSRAFAASTPCPRSAPCAGASPGTPSSSPAPNAPSC